MKNRLLLAVSSALFVMAAHAQQPPPSAGPGGIPANANLKNCAGVHVTNGVLHALCSPTPLIANAVPLPCPGVIENVAGKLACKILPPAGSYQKTCRNVTIQGTNLVADCERKDRTLNLKTTLPLPCAGNVENVDGVLRCLQPAGGGKPGGPTSGGPGPTTGGGSTPTGGGGTTTPTGGTSTGTATPTTGGPAPGKAGSATTPSTPPAKPPPPGK